MAVTKHYVDTITNGVKLHSSIPVSPMDGDIVYDHNTMEQKVYYGGQWILISASRGPEPPRVVPSDEELEKHPGLKEAWEEYMIIRKLLGI